MMNDFNLFQLDLFREVLNTNSKQKKCFCKKYLKIENTLPQ